MEKDRSNTIGISTSLVFHLSRTGMKYIYESNLIRLHIQFNVFILYLTFSYRCVVYDNDAKRVVVEEVKNQCSAPDSFVKLMEMESMEIILGSERFHFFLDECSIDDFQHKISQNETLLQVIFFNVYIIARTIFE